MFKENYLKAVLLTLSKKGIVEFKQCNYSDWLNSFGCLKKDFIDHKIIIYIKKKNFIINIINKPIGHQATHHLFNLIVFRYIYKYNLITYF